MEMGGGGGGEGMGMPELNLPPEATEFLHNLLQRVNALDTDMRHVGSEYAGR
jgi:hypothetical protein